MRSATADGTPKALGAWRRRAAALCGAAAAMAVLLVGPGSGAAPAAEPSSPAPSGPVTTEFGPPLSIRVIYNAFRKRDVTYYIDKWGIPHALAISGDKPGAEAALEFMNKRLAAARLHYDSTKGSGYVYVFQDDTDGVRMVEKETDTHDFTGSTADMLKLTWYNGKLLSVDTVDATSAGAKATLDQMSNTINNKLRGGGKNQTENVAFTPATKEQAEQVAARFKGNPNVRVVMPSSGYDTGEFGAGTEEMKQAAASSPFVADPGDCAPGQQQSLSLGEPASRPAARDAGFTRRIPDCGGQENEATAKAPGGLADELGSPAADPGGIDFSRLELHYLADPGKGGLRYAFQAPLAASGDRSRVTGMANVSESSDAFFTWLELDPSTFWVNLNPNEPDRIVDAQLGKTDAGRVLLQADLTLKKTTGKLIHPDTAVGDRFWKGMSGDCMSFRTWIVPGTATVYAKGDELYILKSPLNVEMETQYLKLHGGSGAASCPQQSKAVQDHNEALFRQLILPKVVTAVNTAPEYADLRRVYLSRVAAEWYRQLSEKQTTTYGSLIDKGDVTPYATRRKWQPIDTFHAYVDSYTKGEFKVTHRTRKGDMIYTNTYIYGGVDFTKVAFASLTADQAEATMPALTRNVGQSLKAPARDAAAKEVWLGGGEPAQAAQATHSGKPGAKAGAGTGTTGGAADASAHSGTPVKGWAVLAAAALLLLLFVRGALRRRNRRRPAGR